MRRPLCQKRRGCPKLTVLKPMAAEVIPADPVFCNTTVLPVDAGDSALTGPILTASMSRAPRIAPLHPATMKPPSGVWRMALAPADTGTEVVESAPSGWAVLHCRAPEELVLITQKRSPPLKDSDQPASAKPPSAVWIRAWPASRGTPPKERCHSSSPEESALTNQKSERPAPCDQVKPPRA